MYKRQARLPDLTITDRHKRVLPAYPSDHFGVLTTLAPAGQKPSPKPVPKPAPKPAAASFFAPRTKKAKTTATVKYRGAAIPDGWQLVDGALLVGLFGGSSQDVRRLAGFVLGQRRLNFGLQMLDGVDGREHSDPSGTPSTHTGF